MTDLRVVGGELLPPADERRHLLTIADLTGEGVIATITVFETEEAAVASTAAARSWVQESLPEIASLTPQVTAGATTGLG